MGLPEPTTTEAAGWPAVESAAGGRRGLLATAALLLFVSGVSALVYQVLWLRLLGLVFGVTVYAASTVLASFMGGLALGSALGGRLADRIRRPLLGYAIAEAAVGVLAVGTPPALRAVQGLYVRLYPLIGDHLGRLTLVRFLLSSLVLLVPTTLMGATFPLIVRSCVLDSRRLDNRAGLLYASNTAGGIAGTLLAGFYLIGGIGIAASFWLAAILNWGVGLVGAALSVAFERSPALASEEPERPEARGQAGILSAGARRLVLWVFCLSGLASLALEVVWFRILVLFLQITTYAFTIMLATFLAGIAAGSALLSLLIRRRHGSLLLLAALELGVAVAAVFSLVAIATSYDTVALLQPFLHRPAERRVALMIVMSVLVLFPATMLLGMAFPLGLRLWAVGAADHEQASGRRVGQFYSLNVLGSIVGAVLGGFLLLPLLGSRGSVEALAGLFLLSGLVLLVAARGRRALVMGFGGLICFLVVCRLAPDPFAVALAHRYPGERLLWQEEGVQTTVSVQRMANGVRVMYLDGLHQASDAAAMVDVHRRIGALALALHPHPHRALVIGLGGGVTAGAVARDMDASVCVVELSLAVVRGAHWFHHVNSEVLARPNVDLRIDDGRNFLLLTREHFDVITADIIRPNYAGAGNVYSTEYFALARRALADDGVMVQWIDPANAAQHRLLLRTFLSVFPESTLWADGSLVAGTRSPLHLDPADMEARLRDPSLREALSVLGVSSLDSLRSLYRAGPDTLRRFVGPGQLVTDDRPLVEYFLSLPKGHRPIDFPAQGGAHDTELR